MTKVLTALLAIVLFIPAMALAQSDDQQQNDKRQQQQQNQAAEIDRNGVSTLPHHTMSGMVSNGGKTLTSDNTAYIVQNPGKLKNYDNQTVSVEYQFDTDKNAIHILKVNPASQP